jgi:hypothetical protein
MHKAIFIQKNVDNYSFVFCTLIYEYTFLYGTLEDKILN